MKNKTTTLVMLPLLFVLASCASSRKIDFNTAYKFSTYSYRHHVDSAQSTQEQNTIASVREAQAPAPLLASSDDASSALPPADPMEKIEDHAYAAMGLDKQTAEAMTAEELQHHVSQLSSKEKHAVRKTIKKEFRDLKKREANPEAKSLDSLHISASGDYTRLAIIVGGVGLILLIIGAVFSVGLLSFFGALAVVAGAVLFIMDQV